MRLITGPLSMFGAKAEIALAEKGIACEVAYAPFSLRDRYALKHPDVMRINPKGQVPVLIDQGLELFDSTQIFEYLEDLRPAPSLWPRTVEARARARLMELKSDEIFFPNVIALMSPTGDAAQKADARATIAALYDESEQELGAGDFLAGEFGFADIAFIAAHFFAACLGADLHARHQGLAAWRGRVCARPAVADVLGRMRAYLCSNGIAGPSWPYEAKHD